MGDEEEEKPKKPEEVFSNQEAPVLSVPREINIDKPSTSTMLPTKPSWFTPKRYDFFLFFVVVVGSLRV